MLLTKGCLCKSVDLFHGKEPFHVPVLGREGGRGERRIRKGKGGGGEGGGKERKERKYMG